jgi:hypothetical protein
MKRLLSAVALTALCATLAGCATGYHSSGLTGGFTDEPGPGETRQVFFFGNGFIKAEKVETYLLYRCAELAKQGGHPYFSVYDSLSEGVLEKPRERPFTRAIFGKPSGRVFLLFHTAPVPGGHATDDVLARLGPEVKG